MEPTNLEQSEKIVAAILNFLLENGLQDCELVFSNLGLDDSFKAFFFPSAQWLIDEGLIRGGAGRLLDGDAWVSGAVLTSTGFARLGANFGSGEERVSGADRAAQIAKSEKGSWQFGDFLGGLAGGLTKSIGGG